MRTINMLFTLLFLSACASMTGGAGDKPSGGFVIVPPILPGSLFGVPPEQGRMDESFNQDAAVMDTEMCWVWVTVLNPELRGFLVQDDDVAEGVLLGCYRAAIMLQHGDVVATPRSVETCAARVRVLFAGLAEKETNFGWLLSRAISTGCAIGLSRNEWAREDE